MSASETFSAYGNQSSGNLASPRTCMKNISCIFSAYLDMFPGLTRYLARMVIVNAEAFSLTEITQLNGIRKELHDHWNDWFVAVHCVVFG